MKNILLATGLFFALCVPCFASTVVLQWDANPVLDQVTAYNVYQDGVKVSTIAAPTTTVTLPTVSATAHTFYVTATNSSGESLASNTVNMLALPGAPSGLKVSITFTMVTP